MPVQGYIYPNETELAWSILVVLYPYITGLVAGAFILASLESVSSASKPSSLPIGWLCSRHSRSCWSPRFRCSFTWAIPSVLLRCI